MTAKFFLTQAKFREWLKKHHKKETQLLVGFYKTGSGKPSISWPQSVDQALCFGWIDGVRKSIDEESYSIRFTPRKPSSIWSTINIHKIEVLNQSGLMTPEGQKAFALRKESRSGIYSHENKTAILTQGYRKRFKENKEAWEYFTAQAPSYKKIITHWIMTAKQEKTHLSRLEKAIAISAKHTKML